VFLKIKNQFFSKKTINNIVAVFGIGFVGLFVIFIVFLQKIGRE